MQVFQGRREGERVSSQEKEKVERVFVVHVCWLFTLRCTFGRFEV